MTLYSFFHILRRNDSKIATKTLVEMGANVHLKNDYGLYPIHFAASRGNKDLCRILVSYKEVDVNVTDHGLVRRFKYKILDTLLHCQKFVPKIVLIEDFYKSAGSILRRTNS